MAKGVGIGEVVLMLGFTTRGEEEAADMVLAVVCFLLLYGCDFPLVVALSMWYGLKAFNNCCSSLKSDDAVRTIAINRLLPEFSFDTWVLLCWILDFGRNNVGIVRYDTHEAVCSGFRKNENPKFIGSQCIHVEIRLSTRGEGRRQAPPLLRYQDRLGQTDKRDYCDCVCDHHSHGLRIIF